MWLYTVVGFFSVIQKPGDSVVTIRARIRSDLERFKQLYLPDMSEITETPTADYGFRGTASHAAFADALYHISQEIDYPNFKNAISERDSRERAKIYEKIWAASLELRHLSKKPASANSTEIPHRSPLSVSQRLMMRALYAIHKYEAMRTWRCMPFYAVTEKLSLVDRVSNQHELSPEAYAKALARDGLSKGWLDNELSQKEWHEVLTVFVYRFLQDDSTFRTGDPWVDD